MLSGLGGSTALSWLLTPASAGPWCSAPAQLLAHSSCSACSASHLPAHATPLPSSGPKQSQTSRLLSQPPLLAVSTGQHKGGHQKPTHPAAVFKTGTKFERELQDAFFSKKKNHTSRTKAPPLLPDPALFST